MASCGIGIGGTEVILYLQGIESPEYSTVDAVSWYCTSFLCQRFSVAFTMPFSMDNEKDTLGPLLYGCVKGSIEWRLGFYPI